MKFSQMPYTRLDIDALKQQLTEVRDALRSAASVEDQIAAIDRLNVISGHVSTMSNTF